MLPDLIADEISPWISGILYFFCLLLSLSLLVSLIATRPLRHPTIKSYVMLGIVVNLWLLFSILHQLPTHPQLKIGLFRLSTPLWLFLGTLSLRFVDSITIRPRALAKYPFFWIAMVFSILGVATPWIEESYGVGPLGYHSVNGFLALPAIFLTGFMPFALLLMRLTTALRETKTSERGALNALFWTTVISMSIPAVFSFMLPLLGIAALSELAPAGFVFLLYGYYYATLARKDTVNSLYQAAGDLLDGLKDGVLLLDLNGKVEYCNPSAENLLGLQKEQLMNRIFAEVLPEYQEDFWYQDFPFRIERHNRSVSFNLSSILQKHRGIIQGKILILHDITELEHVSPSSSSEPSAQKTESPLLSLEQAVALREAHERIREREYLLQSIMDQLPFQVYLKDRRGIYILQNRLDREKRGNLLGYTQDAAPYESVRVLEEKLADQKVLSGETHESEYEVNERGQISRWRSIKKPLYSEGNQIQGILGILMDITEMHQIEKERMEFKERLLQAHKMEAIGTLAGGIAHDFNNILGSLTGYAELAAEVLPPETPAQNYLKEVLIAAERGKQLIQQILIFSRKEEKNHVLVSLTFTLRETAHLIRGNLPGNILLKLDIPEQELFLYGDAIDLHRIIMNLCSNALYAMRSTGGILRIAVDSVEFRENMSFGRTTIPRGRWNCLRIQDTGCGIPEHILPRIFDPFFTTKKNNEGTGLGLSVVLGIVQTWGGYIGVESSPERGTEFRIYFPVPVRQDRQADREQHKKPDEKAHILLMVHTEDLSHRIRRIMANHAVQWSVLSSLDDMPRLWRIAPWQLAVIHLSDLELPPIMLIRQWRSQGITSSFLFLHPPDYIPGNDLDFLDRVTWIGTHESDRTLLGHMERMLWQKSL